MSASDITRTPWYHTVTALLVAGCLVAIVNFGIRSTFGFFTLPISEAHGWPREIFSFAMAVHNLVWGLATPVAGMLADRYGSARVLMTGAVIYCLGLIMMAFTETPFMFNVGGGLLVGIGVAFSSFSIVMAALGRIVPPERRSWAFGIATASGSMGQFIFAPLGAALIAAYGWQNALLVLAGLSLLIILFAAPLMVHNTSSARITPGEADITMRQAIGTAFGHRSYLLLVSGFFVCGFQLAFIVVHMPPYLAEHGISKEFAGLAMGLIGLFNVVGSYAAGIIGGKGEKRVPLAFIYLLRSVLVAGFLLMPVTPLTTLLFTMTIGVLWLSTVPLTMGLVTVMFGTRYMATLYGFVFVSHQLGSFIGVWLGGRLYDAFGSYDIVWWLSVALGIFAFIVHLPIREQRQARFAAA
ncbi:MFS transporter [Aestuariivirga sp.]|jgi:predicted MFS family arabinose efflux permease|uniref:MFS transporter n=1 Tax=Aestuariivirga sp. TaxID=2650926 RepID=UPI0037849CAD